jgi:hypothetical protein
VPKGISSQERRSDRNPNCKSHGVVCVLMPNRFRLWWLCGFLASLVPSLISYKYSLHSKIGGVFGCGAMTKESWRMQDCSLISRFHLLL